MQLKLTAQGRRKVEDFTKRIRQEAPGVLRAGVRDRCRPEVTTIVRQNFSKAVEGEILSKGIGFTLASSRSGGQTGTTTDIGTTEGERFFKTSNQKYVEDAILQEEVTILTGPIPIAAIGNTTKLNRQTGFSWKRHGSKFVPEETLDTEPFDHKLIQCLEYGGTWTVRPREGRKFLHPEWGLFTEIMIKSLPPLHMYKIGLQLAKAKGLIEYIRKRLSERLRMVKKW